MEIKTWKCDVCGEVSNKRHGYGHLKLSGIVSGTMSDKFDYKDVCCNCTSKLFTYINSLKLITSTEHKTVWDDPEFGTKLEIKKLESQIKDLKATINILEESVDDARHLQYEAESENHDMLELLKWAKSRLNLDVPIEEELEWMSKITKFIKD